MFYTILLIWIAFLKTIPQGVNDSPKANKILRLFKDALCQWAIDTNQNILVD